MNDRPKQKLCPICKKPRVEQYTPFCSTRCRDRDLAQWFTDGYALPGPPAMPEDLDKGE
ncbi:zinc-binding protein [Croceicoccus estronivorus]|uniref:DNA gyrase inhibitor YacG n=1 Tax=Croceicoccus estronivorus TaxID=1172626 RepID=UPI000835563E|nr:DNA gyrase inhibitor YacG [Croceicoccus estronivorus]OCC22668.1 zinc-binding protein [Croceicoccus estronivorus]